jgi:hypothetical protein
MFNRVFPIITAQRKKCAFLLQHKNLNALEMHSMYSTVSSRISYILFEGKRDRRDGVRLTSRFTGSTCNSSDAIDRIIDRETSD